MRVVATAALLLAVLPGCTDAQMLGAVAIEKRKVMNDLQARATLAGLCDISVGAVYRLPASDQQAVEIACGEMPVRLEAGE
jgi:hypothetical protein